jgi:hypothetical protein
MATLDELIVRIQADTKQLRGEIGKATKVTDKFSKDTNKSIKKMDSSFAGLKKNWIATTAIIAGASIAISKAVGLAFDAAKFESQQVAFRNLAKSHGAMADDMISNLKRISAGTIDTQTLIEKAGTALLLGIDPTALTKLMEVARASSRVTGQSVSQAFSDISMAVGRQSRMILDNLGIIVRVEDANKEYAKQLGKTSEALTDAERKQAFLNATLAAGEDIIQRVDISETTRLERMQKMTAALTDLKLGFGSLISTLITFPLDVIDKITLPESQFQETLAGLEDVQKHIEAFGESSGTTNRLKELADELLRLERNARLAGVEFGKVRGLISAPIKEDPQKAIDAINEAFKALGISSEQSLKKTATDALKNFTTIRNSGTATPNEIAQAYESAKSVIVGVLSAMGTQLDKVQEKGAAFAGEFRDVADSVDEIRLVLDQLSTVASMPTINVDGLEVANSDLDLAIDSLDQLDSTVATPRVEVQGIDSALNQIYNLQNELNSIGGIRSGAPLRYNSSGSSDLLGRGGQLSIPLFQSGTPFVPRDMLALLHKGERVVPANENNTNYGGVTINIVGVSGDTRSLTRQIRNELETLEGRL